MLHYSKQKEKKLNLGYLNVFGYLNSVRGQVVGSVITDAKERYYRREYVCADVENMIFVSLKDGHGDTVCIQKTIELDESLVAFFGLYSGDGAKGSEDQSEFGRIVPKISFSQKEKHLIRFATDQFRRLFPKNIRFTFSLGEDSAYFMAGEGADRLNKYYLELNGSGTPLLKELSTVRTTLNNKDNQYINEVRPDVAGTNEEHLAFYYQHQKAMEAILVAEKTAELVSVGIEPADDIKNLSINNFPISLPESDEGSSQMRESQVS